MAVCQSERSRASSQSQPSVAYCLRKLLTPPALASVRSPRLQACVGGTSRPSSRPSKNMQCGTFSKLNTLVKLDRNCNKKDRREGALIRGVVRFYSAAGVPAAAHCLDAPKPPPDSRLFPKAPVPSVVELERCCSAGVGLKLPVCASQKSRTGNAKEPLSNSLFHSGLMSAPSFRR